MSKQQVCTQVYSLTGQTEGRRKVFFGGNKDPLNYITNGSNVNHYKSVHHPLSTLPVKVGNTLAVFKTNQ